MRNVILSALVLSLALFGQASAGNDSKSAVVPTKGVAENGPEVKKSIYDLTHKISWKTSLDDAKAQARREGKMIFWWHLLGELDGTT